MTALIKTAMTALNRMMIDQTFLFIIYSMFFGVGLAMDAFSVSMANGLREPHMTTQKAISIAGTFAFFQTAMPLLGWLFIHTISTVFLSLQKYIPWIAFVLLCYIGGKMLLEGLHSDTNTNPDADPVTDPNPPTGTLGVKELLLQGIATSIDALSVGFTTADYPLLQAVTESLIIGGVTYIISFLGVYIGKKLGVKLSGAASLLGGTILILIGIKILV